MQCDTLPPCADASASYGKMSVQLVVVIFVSEPGKQDTLVPEDHTVRPNSDRTTRTRPMVFPASLATDVKQKEHGWFGKKISFVYPALLPNSIEGSPPRSTSICQKQQHKLSTIASSANNTSHIFQIGHQNKLYSESVRAANTNEVSEVIALKHR